MPYFGPGVDQHVNPLPLPTWVFTPTPTVTGPSVRLYNEGTQVVYVGGVNVSPFNGMPIYPQNKPVELANCPTTIYSCSNSVAGAVGGTVTSASTAGQNVFVAASSVSTTTFFTGSTMIIGRVGSQEVLTISTISTSYTTISTSTNAVYDHAGTSPLYPATVYPGQLRVTAGVL